MSTPAAAQAPAPPAAPERRGLQRVLSAAFGLAVTVGVTIGVGILRTPGDIAAQIPNPWLYMGIWVLGGLYALIAALSLAELGAMLPRSGGQYVAARHAYGPYTGFVVGWTDWLGICGTVAAVALVLAESAGSLVPALSGRTRLLAGAVILVVLAVQIRGTRWGAYAQGFTSIVKAFGFAVLIAACLAWSGPQPETRPPPVREGFALFTAIIAALQGIVFTYDGWTGPLYFAGEMQETGRDMPRSMRGGVLSVMAVYLLVNLAFLHVLGIGGMAGDPLVAAKAGSLVFGGAGAGAVAVLVVLAMLGALSANLMMGPRVLYAMSGDGLAAAGATVVNAGGTPVVAALASGAGALAFIALPSLGAVLSVLAFLFVACYVVSLSAVFVLRRRQPEAPRPYRVWGYPFSTGLVLLGSLTFLAGALATDTRNSLLSLGLVALSYPVYRFLERGATGR